MDTLVNPDKLQNVFRDITNIVSQGIRLRGRPPSTNRAKRICKNGNWSDDQFKAVIVAHDVGLNMRQAAMKFKHLYGM